MRDKPPKRATTFEIWSGNDEGGVIKHGSAFGLTLEDACKQLASESIDFWTYYDKGKYRGHQLFATSSQASSQDVPPEKA